MNLSVQWKTSHFGVCVHALSSGSFFLVWETHCFTLRLCILPISPFTWAIVVFHSRGCVASFFRMLLIYLTVLCINICMFWSLLCYTFQWFWSPYLVHYILHTPHTSLVFHACVMHYCYTFYQSCLCASCYCNHGETFQDSDLFHNTKNGLEMYFECEFSPFSIQTFTWSHPCIKCTLPVFLVPMSFHTFQWFDVSICILHALRTCCVKKKRLFISQWSDAIVCCAWFKNCIAPWEIQVAFRRESWLWVVLPNLQCMLGVSVVSIICQTLAWTVGSLIYAHECLLWCMDTVRVCTDSWLGEKPPCHTWSWIWVTCQSNALSNDLHPQLVIFYMRGVLRCVYTSDRVWSPRGASVWLAGRRDRSHKVNWCLHVVSHSPVVWCLVYCRL